jgi:hypothetical protein
MSAEERKADDMKNARRQLRHLVDDLGMKFVIDCGMEKSHMTKPSQGEKE